MFYVLCFAIASPLWARFQTEFESLYILDGASKEQLGYSLENISDIDGDGYNDFLVAAIEATTSNGIDGGFVYAISAKTGQQLYRIEGQYNEKLGSVIMAMDDLTGDGIQEFICSARFGAGACYIFDGSNGTQLAAFYGEGSKTDAFGFAVETKGDYNGDGVADLAIGAPRHFANGLQWAGRVYVYAGPDMTLMGTIDGEANEYLGGGLQVQPNVDGGGRDELLAMRRIGGTIEGYIWNGTNFEQTRTIVPPEPFTVGSYQSMVGGFDVNCDGYTDFYIGDNTSGGDQGFLFSGADGTLLNWFQAGGRRVYGLGRMIEDVNGDGHGDLMIGQLEQGNGPGSVFIHSGRDQRLLQTMTPPPALHGSSFGADMILLDDLDGDGIREYAVAASFYSYVNGRVYVIKGQAFAAPDESEICDLAQEEPQLDYNLVYPWVSQNGTFESSLIATNLADEAAQVRFTAQRETGTAMVSEIFTIAANGMLEMDVKDIFPQMEDGAGLAVRMDMDRPEIRGRWVTFNKSSASKSSPSQGVAIHQDNTTLSGRRILIGYLPADNENFSGPVLVNTGDAATDVLLSIYDEQGQVIYQETLADLAPMRPFARLINDLVPNVDGAFQAIAESADQNLTGVGFVFNNQGETAIGNATAILNAGSEASGSTHLVYPWVSNSDQFSSLIVVNNYSDSLVSFSLTARRADGSEASTESMNLAPMGFFVGKASELFPALGSGAGYTVRCVVDHPMVRGRWVSNNLWSASGNSPSQGVAVRISEDGQSLSMRSGQEILIGFLPLEDGNSSGPVLVNLGNAPASITLRFYDEDGNLVAEDSSLAKDLEPMSPFAASAAALVPGTARNLFLRATSDSAPITGVGFVFNSFNEPAIGNAEAISVPTQPKSN